MIPLLGVSNTFRLILLYFLLAVLHGPGGADPPYPICTNTTYYTVNSTFHDNLGSLFNHVSSNASLLRFYNATVGNDPDTVYGLFFCLGFVTQDTCKTCVDSAIQDIKRLCPNNSEAIVYEEYCQFSYSDRSFFGHVDETANLSKDNKLNITNPDGYRLAAMQLLDDLSGQAAFNSTFMYATGNISFMEPSKVYGLVQCSRDLSRGDCKRCLQNATRDILNCCYFSRGARLFSKSCYLRYELYAFYKGESEASLPPSNLSGGGDHKKLSKIVILLIVLASVSIVLLGSCIYCLVVRKGTQKEINEKIVQELPLHDMGGPAVADFSYRVLQGSDQMKPQDFPLIDFTTIKAATDNFSDLNKLGQGGFGPVYKGILPNGSEVAVKRLSTSSEQGVQEFMNEVLLIMKLQHKNLVRLLGCCLEGEEQILIYEYMPNSSLDVILFDPRRRAQLDWRRRFNIIGGIARGILYLHQDSRLRIIHRDLKASNVLLDQDMNPKISDFGMARIFGGNNGEANTARIVGTYGYMAPEYAMGGLYSIKSDVFSFGVLALEIITGRRNAGFHLSKRAPSLLAYVWRLWNEEKGLDLMDPLLTDSCCSSEFLRCIHIGLLCVQEDPNDRPTMSSVVVMLRSESVVLRQPQQPAFSVGRIALQSVFSSLATADDLSINGLTVSIVAPR